MSIFSAKYHNGKICQGVFERGRIGGFEIKFYFV